MNLPDYTEFIAARRAEDALNEGILGSILSGATAFVKGALRGLMSPFTNLIKDIKTEWKNGITADKMRDKMIATVENAYKALFAEIDKAKSVGEVGELMSKSQQMQTNLQATIVKQLQSMKESWQIEDHMAAINESALGTARVGMDVAGLFVSRAMSLASEGMKRVMAAAAEEAKNNKDLNAYKRAVKGDLQKEMAKIKTDIQAIKTDQLLAMRDKRAGGPAKSGWEAKKAARLALKYEPNQKARYINKKGEKVEGLVRKDLGAMVEFESSDGDGTTFKKKKEDVLGVVRNDGPAATEERPAQEAPANEADAKVKTGDWIVFKDLDGKEHTGVIQSIASVGGVESDAIAVKADNKSYRVERKDIVKKTTAPEESPAPAPAS